MALTDKLTAVADAIRAKTGKTDSMTLDEMPSEIAGIEGGGGGEPAEVVLQQKSVVPSKSSQEVTADSGYDGLEKVTVEAIPDEYIVPNGTLDVVENGTHNAREYAEVSVNVPIPDGYIQPSGELKVTENGTHDVNIYEFVKVDVPVPDGYIQPSGTLNLTENGTHDVTEYAEVNVTVAGSTNTEAEELAAFLDNTMTELNNSRVTSLRTRICQYATKLVTVNLPNVTTMNTYVFYGCTALVTAYLPKATSVPSQAFYNCTKLKHADCGQAGSIAAQAFNACSALTELILRKTDSICTLSNVNGVNNSPIGKGTGYVYVPRNLLEQYAQASNWSTFAAQFRAIEDYPEITGG